MNTPAQQITESLAGAASVTVTSLYGLGRDAAMPADEFPLAQIVEVLDTTTCPLCRYLDGKIVRKGTPEYDRYRQPSHINCRRIMVDIGRDEVGPDGLPTRPDEIPLEEVHALEQKYGHFHVDPSKYAELRIPARPEGRDFTFIRGANGEPGRLVWRKGLSEAAWKQTNIEAYDIWIDDLDQSRVRVDPSARGMEFDTIRSSHIELDRLSQQWPQAVQERPITLEFGPVPGDENWAEWSGETRTIRYQGARFATRHGYDQMLSTMSDASKKGWSPPGCDDVVSLARHEFGHRIAELIHRESETVIGEWFNEYKEDLIGFAVSGTRNSGEAFAECFSASFRDGGTRPEMMEAFLRLLTLIR